MFSLLVHFSTLRTFCFRCNDINQVKQYAKIAHKIEYAVDDEEIFLLTGCLSKCDKYYYSAQARSELRPYSKLHTNAAPRFQISFLLPNGRNEIKEQVKFNLIMIVYLYIA